MFGSQDVCSPVSSAKACWPVTVPDAPSTTPGVEPARPALILESAGDSTTLPLVSTLILNLDDRLKRRLDALAAHNHKPLPDWAAEQLGRLAADAGEISAASYSPEWMAAFGSIDDPSFRSPERPLPTHVEPLDSGI